MSVTFAETLRRIRVEKGLSQQQLADQLFVDRSSVAHWESGRRVPDAILISRIAEILAVDVAELFDTPEQRDEKPNVILVDDEKIILHGSLPILKAAMPDAVITCFTIPSEAVRYARTNRIALAFLDIEMGTMSGLDLCRELLEIHPRTNVVFLTAYMDYAFNAWDTGACGFALKPLSPEGLQKQLARLRYPVRGLGGA